MTYTERADLEFLWTMRRLARSAAAAHDAAQMVHAHASDEYEAAQLLRSASRLADLDDACGVMKRARDRLRRILRRGRLLVFAGRRAVASECPVPDTLGPVADILNDIDRDIRAIETMLDDVTTMFTFAAISCTIMRERGAS